MNKKDVVQRILVFRIGQLGDTIVALPAMWAVRKTYPTAHLALLCDRHQNASYVLSTTLLSGSGLFDEFLEYPVSDTVGRFSHAIHLIRALRKKQFDTLVYLAPTTRTPRQINRDRWFFRLAGIRNFLGMEGFEQLQQKRAGEPLRPTPPESELLLRRVVHGEQQLSPLLDAGFALNPGLREAKTLQNWLDTVHPDGGRPWIAVGPGTKMPAKQWPLERFEWVIARLIEEFDVWPVVFGGPDEREMGESLLRSWKRGYNAAGSLELRTAALALKRCVLYLGNDTGTMHLAAAAGAPCVALFSAREHPGLWYPYGTRHRVFRSDIDCEGCFLVTCLDRENECLKKITSQEVLKGCVETLRETLNHNILINALKA